MGNTTTIRRPTSFRFDNELIETLKRRAKEAHSSLNNYVERLLKEAVEEPNAETKAAMDEARHHADMIERGISDDNDYVDLTSVEAMLKSAGNAMYKVTFYSFG